MKKMALIIEDNHSDQLINKAILESMGYECIISKDGGNAIKHLLNQKFSLIVLDLQLPDINGFQFLLNFRSIPQTLDVPVVVVSANDEKQTKQFSKYLGAAEFIKKPLNLNKHKKLLIKYLYENTNEVFYE